ncbi:MAG: glycosyltransferase [Deltaproteobacteria bacterium]|nr:glycosyltransferase [Deltaproteobacteria bacterium]
MLPAYNEARDLGALLESIDQAMVDDEIDYEIIVVDDGSVDETCAEVERRAPYILVEIIRHPSNRGLGETIRDGLFAAASRCGVALRRTRHRGRHGRRQHAQPRPHPCHDEAHPRRRRRGDRVALPPGRRRGRGAVAPASAQPLGLVVVHGVLPDPRRARLHVRLPRLPRPRPAGCLRALRRGVHRPGRLPVHGRHPAQAAPARRDLRRGPDDPALRPEEWREQDERPAHHDGHALADGPASPRPLGPRVSPRAPE